jgi:hypothetical protein
VKALAKLMNAIADAWNAGAAPWAYDEKGHSVAVKTWNRAFQKKGDAAALAAVEGLVHSHGLVLVRGKLVPIGGLL